MDNQGRPFFESLPYEMYRTVSKQTFYGLILLGCTLVTLVSMTAVLLYQLSVVRTQTASFQSQKKQFEKMEFERKELIQKLAPIHAKNKKMVRAAQKLATIDALLERLFAPSESIKIVSCFIKKKQLALTLESTHDNYVLWTKKILESKILKDVTTTHIKKTELNTIATIEAEIVF